MLLFFGDQDPFIPNEEVAKIKRTLADLKKTAEVKVYAGAPHGFFCSERESYRADAAKDAWGRLRRSSLGTSSRERSRRSRWRRARRAPGSCSPVSTRRRPCRPSTATSASAAAQLRDHIGWDIGAATVTEELSRQLGAPAVLSAASRLLVDCNRDLADADLMPHASHGVAIPGNARIEAGDRDGRLRRFYEPYHAAVDATVAARPDALLLSVHSFTPELNGRHRPFDVGVLFDAYDDLARRSRRRRHRGRLRGTHERAVLRPRRPDLQRPLARPPARHRYLELEINNRLLRRDDEARAVARRLADAVARLLEPQA